MSAATGTAPPPEWYLARDGEQFGPLSDAELRKLVEFGHLKPNDLLWREGFPDWRSARILLEDKALTAGAAKPAATTPAEKTTAVAQPSSAPPSEAALGKTVSVVPVTAAPAKAPVAQPAMQQPQPQTQRASAYPQAQPQPQPQPQTHPQYHAAPPQAAPHNAVPPGYGHPNLRQQSAPAQAVYPSPLALMVCHLGR